MRPVMPTGLRRLIVTLALGLPMGLQSGCMEVSTVPTWVYRCLDDAVPAGEDCVTEDDAQEVDDEEPGPGQGG